MSCHKFSVLVHWAVLVVNEPRMPLNQELSIADQIWEGRTCLHVLWGVSPVCIKSKQCLCNKNDLNMQAWYISTSSEKTQIQNQGAFEKPANNHPNLKPLLSLYLCQVDTHRIKHQNYDSWYNKSDIVYSTVKTLPIFFDNLSLCLAVFVSHQKFHFYFKISFL